MKNRILLFVVICLLSTVNFTYAQVNNVETKWAKSFNGNYWSMGKKVVTDAVGNTYTTGFFAGTFSFQSLTLSATGTNKLNTVFVSKTDPNGTLLWVKSVGGEWYDSGESIAVDATGNVYITGTFMGTVDFDPSATGTLMLTAGPTSNSGATLGFVLKLDNLGNFVWARKLGGRAKDIVVDITGNTYITGIFNNGESNPNYDGTFQLTSAGSNDIFICKLDISGNITWAKRMGGTSYDEVGAVALDGAGNIYITGGFDNIADFNPSDNAEFNLTSLGGSDIFISKLTTNGDLVWAKNIGGTGSEYAYDMKVTSGGTIFIVGTFSGTIDFDPGAGVSNLVSVSSLDNNYTLKLDTDGKFTWVRRIEGVASAPRTVTADASGNVYTSGGFTGTVDFNPDNAATSNLTAATDGSLYIHKLDASGNFKWAKAINKTKKLPAGYFSATVNDIAVDISSNVYLTGVYYDNTNFDGSNVASTYLLTSSNIYGDIFLTKYAQPGSALPVTLTSFTVSPGENRSSVLQWSTASEINSNHFEIEHSLNSKSWENIGEVTTLGEERKLKNYSYTHHNLSSGLHYYRLKSVDGDGSFAYSKIVSLKIDGADTFMSLYPNPVTETLILKLANLSEQTQIQLLNGAGQKVNASLNRKEGTIDVRNLPAGLYLLQVSQDGNIGKTHKVLINR